MPGIEVWDALFMTPGCVRNLSWNRCLQWAQLPNMDILKRLILKGFEAE